MDEQQRSPHFEANRKGLLADADVRLEALLHSVRSTCPSPTSLSDRNEVREFFERWRDALVVAIRDCLGQHEVDRLRRFSKNLPWECRSPSTAADWWKVIAHHFKYIERLLKSIQDRPETIVFSSPAKEKLRLSEPRAKARSSGSRAFIGHGRSDQWLKLRAFLDSLELPWDEFNRIPVAGYTTVSRLEQMLDDACIAMLVLTAEDEQADGSARARQNVVHEVGLFQGRLGFRRAILLQEMGCEAFSNIEGLTVIRFASDRIESTFTEIHAILKREGLVGRSMPS